MYSKFGKFSREGAEFVITRPDTPRPWINYLTNGDYCALCSHIGGGFSFYKDHRYNSVLKRGSNVQIEDMPARLIYIKDEETGEVWNANVYPIGKYDTFEARHGMGYTIVSSAYRSIQSNIKYFVPQGTDAEIWDVTLTNNGSGQKTLSVYSYAEFMLGNVALEQAEDRFMAIFNDVGNLPQAMVFYKKWWHTCPGWSEDGKNWPLRAFITTTQKPAAMMSGREAFVGAFRGYANPAAVEGELMPGTTGEGRDLGGAFQWRISLAPGDSWSVKLAVGVQPNEDSEKNIQMIERLQKSETYEIEWNNTINYWEELFNTIKIVTPDDDINNMANYWNKYQLMINFYFGRGPSYFHRGQYPAMRDSCQDAFGVIALNPSLARNNIKRIAHYYFSDGRACGGCNRIGIKEGPSEKVDLPLWLTLAVADYVRETGELDFLDEVVPLADEGESSIYQKMISGIDRMLEDRGQHGLPLIGKGDWNDAANMIGAGGKGESVWLGQFLYFVIQEILPLMEIKGDEVKAAAYRQRAEELKNVIDEHCWDGEWFVRAFKDDGTPVGVKGQDEGFIWINSQTWAVISGISSSERLNKCMDSVEKHLGTKYGLMNLGPAYSKFDPTIGIITGFRRGWKENAAIFSHASSFNVVARAKLGRGRDAVDLFRRILPTGKDSEKYLMEPYVYSQFCAGPDSGEDFGMGAFHWLSGTSAWMFRAMTDYILGVHPELHGLRISPAVDPEWKEFSIKRTFRGAVYTIEFSNPEGVQSGVKEVYLDGTLMDGNLLPLPTQNEHHVKVVMG